MKYFNLEGTYFGGKGAAGVAQKIINQTPPHDMFISGFLGYCRVMQYKRPARYNIGMDMDISVIHTWRLLDIPEIGIFDFVKRDTIEFLEGKTPLHVFLKKIDCLIYLDPPYLLDSRSDPRERYKYELSEDQHDRLIAAAGNLKCMVAISHYPHPKYDELLKKGWRYIDFNSRTRGGTRTERLYMNYPEPTELHDYSYLGENFKEREQIKLKFDRWKAGFDRLSPLEQNMRKQWIKSH